MLNNSFVLLLMRFCFLIDAFVFLLMHFLFFC